MRKDAWMGRKGEWRVERVERVRRMEGEVKWSEGWYGGVEGDHRH
jgi:hypothetical protein